MAESSAPVVLSICFRRLHLRIAAHGYGVSRWPSMSCLPMTSTAARMSAGLWINETESKHHWMQISDELRARGVLGSWHLSMDGETDWRKAPGCIPHATVQRCIVHLIRNSIRYIHANSGCIHEAAEAHLWCHQRQAGPSGIREVQDRLAGLSRRGQRMGKQFLTRRAAL